MHSAAAAAAASAQARASPVTVTASAGPATPADHRQRQDIIRALMRRVLLRDAEYRRVTDHNHPLGEGLGLVDYVVLVAEPDMDPKAVFERLRWGGRVAVVSSDTEQLLVLSKRFRGDSGFVMEEGPATFHAGWLHSRLRWGGRKLYYFQARKVAMILPGQVTERFTFDVRLVRAKPPMTGYMVMKQVPSYGYVYQRLRKRFPDADAETNFQRTHRLVDHVFPVFLSREAAFLTILQRDLPKEYRAKVPRALGVEKGPDGLVRRLYMNWLRVSGPALSQMEFAKQAIDLLRVLHDHVKIIHLDLRLDNMVVTEHGVGFVDFGSAVRMGENLKQSAMLDALFDQMMSTSQIQINLGKMIRSGRLTSSFISAAHGRIDKAVDIFYLALQMRDPRGNPDLRSLIHYDPQSEEARRIALLTDGILRPSDPRRPKYISARDIQQALLRIEQKLEPEKG